MGCCVGDSSEAAGTAISKPRGCTDIVWLIIYVIFCCSMFIIGIFAIFYGNPKRLTNGMDSFGNVCGSTNEELGNLTFSGKDMTEKPYLFYFNLQDMENSMRICVEKCPGVEIKCQKDLEDVFFNTSVNYCRYDVDWSNSSDAITLENSNILTSNPDETKCPILPVYPSHGVLKRCIPVQSYRDTKLFSHDLFAKIYGYLNGLNIFQQILGDLAVTWTTVVILTVVSFGISIVLVLILHFMTALLAYLVLISSCCFALAFTVMLWWTYANLKSHLDLLGDDMILKEMVRNECLFLVYSILSTIFTIALILIAFVVYKRIPIVERLFRESSSAMMSLPCLFIQPFLTYFALATFFCAWLYVVLCIATSDYPTSRKVIPLANGATASQSCNDSAVIIGPLLVDNETLPSPEALTSTNENGTFMWDSLTGWTLIEYKDEIWVKYVWWIYIFGLVWCSEFILACQQMVIASSIASWYFSRDRKLLKCVVFTSTMQMIKYHMGSIALGSLVITLIKIPRLILKFTQRIKWGTLKLIQVLNRCCSGCLQFFENCLIHIHHNAYTVVAIQGHNFCEASKLALSALTQNALQISVVNSMGDFILFLTKCIVAALTGVIAVVVFRRDETLYFYAIPVLLTVFFSYFVAHCVISVFEMAVDTLFLCFCEDHNMVVGTDGTDGKGFYAPKSLLQFMTKDALDYLAPGRRDNSFVLSKKVPIDPKDEDAEESIPMNPYGGTTTANI